MVISTLCVGSMAAATISFVWDPVATATGYWLWRSSGTQPFSRILSASTNTATWQSEDTNIQRFYVTATNIAGESPSSNVVTNFPIIVVPPPTNTPPSTNPPPITVPEAPEIMYVNRITGNRIDLGWATKDLESRSQVWRSMEGQEWRLMANLSPGNLHWSDTSAQQRKSYSYRVQSCTIAGCSPFSSTVTYPPK